MPSPQELFLVCVVLPLTVIIGLAHVITTGIMSYRENHRQLNMAYIKLFLRRLYTIE